MKIPKKIQADDHQEGKYLLQDREGQKNVLRPQDHEVQRSRNQRRWRSTSPTSARTRSSSRGTTPASLIDLGDGIFNIEFHTKMNAVNKNMVDFMQIAADYVMENGLRYRLRQPGPRLPGRILGRRRPRLHAEPCQSQEIQRNRRLHQARTRRDHGNEIRPHSDRRGSLRHDAGRRMRSSALQQTRSSRMPNSTWVLLKSAPVSYPADAA